MKKVIINTSSFSLFFCNMARALKQAGCEIIILNPSYHAGKMYSANCDCLVERIGKENLHKYLKEKKVDVVVMWNGLNNLYLTNLCRTRGVKTWFFENGYLEHTLQMNYSGVNALAEYSNMSLDQILNFKYTFKDLNIEDLTLKEDYRFNMGTYIWGKLFSVNILKNIKDVLSALVFFIKRIIKRIQIGSAINTNIDTILAKPYVFFPLQVNTDTQIQKNSPFSDMYEILESLIPLVQDTGYKLVIKIHPAESDVTFYNKYSAHENVILTKDADIDALIENSQCVVTINSSVGFQALAKNKKVITFGDAFYNHAPGVTYCNLYKDSFLDIFNKVMEQKVSYVEQDKYIGYFKKNVFIKGNWRRPSKELITSCVKRMLA